MGNLYSFLQITKTKASFGFTYLAEGTRFELAVLSYAGFQDQCHQPLGHPSGNDYSMFLKNIIMVML